MKFRRLKIRSGLLLVALQFLVTMSFTGCGTKPAEVRQEVKNVYVMAASSASMDINLEYAGKIKPAEEVTVSVKMPGRALKIEADVGDVVEKDQMLLTLESKDVQAQYNQSVAALDSARANLERVSDSSLSQQVLQAETAVKQARLQYDDAQRMYDRIKKLYDENSVSRQQMDDAETRVNGAKIQLDTASENLTLLKEKAGPQSVDVASAQVNQSRAAVGLASTQLENAVVTAPISGIISVRNVDEGELVSSAVPAFIVINTKTLVIEISVPDKMVGKVSKGQAVEVKIDALENKSFSGVIDSISPSIDPRTQSYTVKVKMDNAGDAIKPGMLARVFLPVERKTNVLAVPNEAIVMENGLQYVYTVAGDIVKRSPVTTGLSTDKVTEITGGLKAGDAIITEGQSFLNDGEKVNVIKK